MDPWTKEFPILSCVCVSKPELNWTGWKHLVITPYHCFISLHRANPWSYVYELNFGCGVPLSASPVPTWKHTKYAKRPPAGSPKTSPNRAFGLRWNQCNISSKTSMDHQLPLSAIYISTASAVHREETPQCVSGVIIVRNPLYCLPLSNNNATTLCMKFESLHELWWSRWMRWLGVAAWWFTGRPWDAAGRRVCCCFVNGSQSLLTTEELAAASAGQTPVDPLSK